MTSSGINPAKVLAWLRKGGVPLEYEVARLFRGAGFRAEQGRNYVDAIEGKTREIDVVATLLITTAPNTHLLAVIECKSATNKPWVILTTETMPEPWVPIATGDIVEDCKRVPAVLDRLPLGRPHGYSVIEALIGPDDKKDRAHDALEQVVSEAVGLVAAETGSAIAIPVVATAPELFRLTIDGAGNEDLSAVDWYRIRWHGAQAHPNPTIIDVVRRSDLARYATDARHDLQALAETLEVARSMRPPFVGVA